MKHTIVLIALLLCMTPGVAEEEKEEKWDVSKPPGQMSTATLDVKTGTWLSLDVSPDGKTIVFDMLGDLYLLSSQGGGAKSLTSGIEWDMQPVFSPDGKKIAFTSDRGGGDNIWIMDLAAGESSAKALTEEKFRLLNQPAWDPSGTHIVARKHYTGTRSLGAGEIWAYHVDGGSGVQLTKRKNDQLDLGEPAFSPGGEYLYYSKDATGGESFKYNKDPNKGIYAIERLNRSTGEIERVLEGAGGAITPRPSPDGRYLAFIRRIRGKTNLMLLDLKDGSERLLFDGLDRDMQETWAIHGVYPRYDWSGDSQQLVFWARGKFWRLAIQEGALPQEIPFQVQAERQIGQAVRFPVEVAPHKFQVKAVRKPVASPSGRTVAFEALGKIWIKTGDSQPRRLTKASGHESNPVFTSESQLIYAHWSDQNLGSLKRQNIDGQSSTVVDEGRYGDISLSPDGRYLVYQRLGRTSLFDSRHTSQSGLYLKDLVEGDTRRIDKSGRLPHFGQESHILFFNKGSHPTKLVRLNLETGESQELAEGKPVSSYLLSPDEKWLAIRENFDLHVTPFVPTGRTQSVDGGSKSLPVKKVSTEVGAYFPGWTRQGSLTWNVGPRFWSFSPSTKAKAEKNLGQTIATATPGSTSVVALLGGKVVTMNGDEVIEDGVVVIKDDRIVAVGGKDTPVPADAYRLACHGKTVLPGLIDVHWHGSFSDGHNFPEINYTGLSSLSFGVTTLHDPSNDTASVFTARELQMAGELMAPRVFSTGTILYGAKAPSYYAHVSSLEDALGHLKRLKSWGAISVKSYNQPRRDQRQQILEAARQTKMMVVPEGGSLFQHNMTMVVDGHTGLEHALPVPNVYDDVVDLWSQTEVGYTPTLGVAYGGVWGENFWYVKTDVWDDKRLNRFVPQEVIDPASRRRFVAPDAEYNHMKAAAGAKKMADKGVRVNLGAHGQREGLAAHWELWMLEQGGMSPHEALRCGTLNGARYLGMDGDLGSLEKGKLADIIVVDGDPLSDIRQSKRVRYTIQGGKVFESHSMRRIGPGAAPEPKLWWR
jgi:imidazolonepropionase-like amidohydrolase/Tol biopolymer transport system component